MSNIEKLEANILADILAYCKENSLDFDEFRVKCLRDGFNIAKYGMPSFTIKNKTIEEKKIEIKVTDVKKEEKKDLYGE